MRQQKTVTTNFETAAPVEEQAAEVPAGKLIQGFEWSQLPGVDEELELALWNAGIVGADDLNKNPQAVIGALMSYHGLGLVDLRNKVKEFTPDE